MKVENILNQLNDAIITMDIKAAKLLCQEALNQDIEPTRIIEEAIVEAVSVIGDKFDAEEYFLAELIFAGEIIKELMHILEPYIKKKNKIKNDSRLVLGTAKGDMHDIGKNVVKTFLIAEGFEVIDLGVDVSPEMFVNAVKNERPNILAISALISSTMPEIKNTIKALKQANLRNQVKIIIGGAPITPQFVENVGADGYAKNAIEGIKICKRWTTL